MFSYQSKIMDTYLNIFSVVNLIHVFILYR